MTQQIYSIDELRDLALAACQNATTLLAGKFDRDIAHRAVLELQKASAAALAAEVLLRGVKLEPPKHD
jgi:hypothetical protein